MPGEAPFRSVSQGPATKLGHPGQRSGPPGRSVKVCRLLLAESGDEAAALENAATLAL
jgi:hypothetical protein